MEKQQKAYKGVIDYFKQKIIEGELRPGEKLPPERDIAEQLSVAVIRCARQSASWI